MLLSDYRLPCIAVVGIALVILQPAASETAQQKKASIPEDRPAYGLWKYVDTKDVVEEFGTSAQVFYRDRVMFALATDERLRVSEGGSPRAPTTLGYVCEEMMENRKPIKYVGVVVSLPAKLLMLTGPQLQSHLQRIEESKKRAESLGASTERGLLRRTPDYAIHCSPSPVTIEFEDGGKCSADCFLMKTGPKSLFVWKKPSGIVLCYYGKKQPDADEMVTFCAGTALRENQNGRPTDIHLGIASAKVSAKQFTVADLPDPSHENLKGAITSVSQFSFDQFRPAFGGEGEHLHVRDREAEAAQKIKTAKSLIGKNDVAARGRLEEVLKEYAGTKTAEEAKAILGELRNEQGLHPKTVPTPKPPKLRTWQDNTGRFSVEAELVDVNEEIVRLRKGDGQVIEVPLDRLSTVDQQFIQQKK